MDVLDGLEPCHARVVDMVRLVVQDHQLVNIAHYHAQIHLGVGGGAAWTFAQKIVHRIFIIGRGGNVVAGIYSVDVRQKDDAGVAGNAHVVLHMQGQLKIVAPVAPVYAVVRDYRVFKEDTQTLKIPVDSIQHYDIGSNH